MIEGPEGTPYHGGTYHGKLKFPEQYPHKPPSIMMITPSGRFVPETRLCLSCTSLTSSPPFSPSFAFKLDIIPRNETTDLNTCLNTQIATSIQKRGTQCGTSQPFSQASSRSWYVGLAYSRIWLSVQFEYSFVLKLTLSLLFDVLCSPNRTFARDLSPSLPPAPSKSDLNLMVRFLNVTSPLSWHETRHQVKSLWEQSFQQTR